MASDPEVIIIGGGVFGCSTAYHLATKGCRDVLLLEARDIGSQSTSQAAGFIRVLRGSTLMTRMARHAIEAFERFQADTGHDIGFRQPGAFLVALGGKTAARLRAWTERGTRLGVVSSLISLEEARGRFPLLETEGVRAVVYEPRDAYLDPPEVAIGYARAAAARGVRIETGQAVRAIEAEGGRVSAVRTDRDRLQTRWVVLAGGAWGPDLARRSGCPLPTVPVRHQLHTTAPLSGVRPEFPMVRFPELATYLRPARGGLMVGGYEANPVSFDPQEITDSLDMRSLEPDRQALRDLTKRVTPFFPALDGAPIASEQQGLPTLTPDGLPLLGEVPGTQGLLVASGDNVGGVSISPTVGHILSDLIIRGAAPYDLGAMAVGRFGSRYRETAALRRACEARYADFGRNYLFLDPRGE